MVNLQKKLINSHVILSHEDWANFKPLLVRAKIPFEPSGYGKDVYIGFFNIDIKTFKLIDELLEQI